MSTTLTNRPKADRTVLLVASKLAERYRRDYEEYLQERRESTRGGPNNRLGYYRPQYCEHGTSLWTDFDNICGGCEDGVTMGDPLQRRTRALREAKERTAKARSNVQRMTDAVVTLELFGVNLTPEQTGQLTQAALRPWDVDAYNY